MKTLILSVLISGVVALATSCTTPQPSYIPVYSDQPVMAKPVYGVVPPPPAPAQPAPQVIVPEAALAAPTPPPPPMGEVIPASPGTDYAWLSGYWTWNGKWIWAGGRWAVRPYSTATWVGGQWVQHGTIYTWSPGHWR